jgi:hypothetical protein
MNATQCVKLIETHGFKARILPSTTGQDWMISAQDISVLKGETLIKEKLLPIDIRIIRNWLGY